MPILRKRQFMADIAVCNGRAITKGIGIYGNGLRRAEARRKAARELDRIKRANPESFACLCEVIGRYYNGRKFYQDRHDGTGYGTRIHEEFHAEVAALGILSVGMMMHPVEESAAYAYEDFIVMLRGTGRSSIATNSVYAKHAVRFIVGTDNPELGAMRANSIGILRRTGAMIGGDSVALAFNYAENFLCYLECLEVLMQRGDKDGKQILFDAMRTAGHIGPENAMRFLLARLSEPRRESIELAYGIDPAKLRLRPLHHREYVEEDLILQ